MKSKKVKFVSLLVVISLVVTLGLSGIMFGCEAEEVVEEAEEVVEEEEEVVEEEEEATIEVEEAAEELTPEEEGLTYWIDQAGLTPSGEFTIYSFKEVDVAEGQIAEKYCETYPDVSFTWVTIPIAEYAAKIAMELETDTAGFDVFWDYAAWDAQFAPWLADITDRIPETLKNDIIPLSTTATSFEGVYHGLPLFCALYGTVYNKDILAQAGYPDGPPETWDEFFKCAQDCTIDENGDGLPEIYGLSNGQCGMYGYFSLFGVVLKTVGGSFWNGDKNNPKSTVNTDAGVRALQIMKTTYMSDFSDPLMADGEEFPLRQSIASKKGAMGIHNLGSPHGVAAADFPDNVANLGYSLHPYDPGYESCTVSGSMGFGIREGGNVDAALGYVLFYSGYEMQNLQTEYYGYPSSRISLSFVDEYIEKYPFVLATVEQGKYAQERYVEPNATDITTAYFPIFENYLNGTIDEETALSQMEESFNSAWEE